MVFALAVAFPTVASQARADDMLADAKSGPSQECDLAAQVDETPLPDEVGSAIPLSDQCQEAGAQGVTSDGVGIAGAGDPKDPIAHEVAPPSVSEADRVAPGDKDVDAPAARGHAAREELPALPVAGVITGPVPSPARPAWLQAAGALPTTHPAGVPGPGLPNQTLPQVIVTRPVGETLVRLPSARATPTASPTGTPTATQTGTPTATQTGTPTATPTDMPTATPTDMPTASPTATQTGTPTATPTGTPTGTPTVTQTGTSSASPSTTRSPTPSAGAPHGTRDLVFARTDPPSSGHVLDVGVAAVSWPGRSNGPIPSDAGSTAPTWWLDPGAPTAWEVSGHPRIGLLARNMASTLEAMRKCFPGASGHVCGFRPGSAYDSIYLRDSAYLAALARYAYPPSHLRSVVEEFLAIQYGDGDASLALRDRIPRPPWPARPGDGAVSAVIDFDMRRDKASVASDEEPSLVRAAYVAFRADEGAEWLRKPIRGRPIIGRLVRAMEWTLTHRRDEVTGLIIRPHTTDWGDIEAGDDGTRGGDAEPTEWTASIYDQSVTYRAFRELAIMLRATGDAGQARTFDSRADDLAARSRQYLWSEARGYFRTHVHVASPPPGMPPPNPSEPHLFDEDEIVSIANAIAVYAGLADDLQTARVIQAIEWARLDASSALPGVSLYPPYPDGTFRSPQMSPGRYQNGAAWDWWAGTQIVAEFARGYSMHAIANLVRMADAWADHPEDIPEWRPIEPDQRLTVVPPPAGSGHYSAAAGTIGEAVILGLFGLDLATDSWAVTPRLGSLSGQARIRIPIDGGKGRFLAYGQRVRLVDGQLVLAATYATDHPSTGWLALRLPSNQIPFSIRIDGQNEPQPWRIGTIGSDTMLTVGAIEPGRHDIEVAWRAPNSP